jgi:sugar lactone lactonase YvrE
MAADRKGNVFVIATTVIYRYSGESGKQLGQIKANDTVTYYYNDIVAAADGTLYAVGGGETVVHMDINGKVISTIPKAISTVTDDSELDAKIAVDGAGNVYLLGTFNNAVFKFGPTGKYINKFGSVGDKIGQFRAPEAIDVDGQGNIYVSDFKGIQVFDKEGQYIDVIDLQGVCFGMAFDDAGKLYIVSNLNNVIKFAISK